ncbi:hypothetical protein OH492_20435 [Vibrio chagasii]|nr:hypothetical protein [Vibrio chagasii]
MIAEGEADIGNEVDDPRARNVDIEVADIHVGKSEYAGKTMAQLHAEIGFGVY